MGDSAAALGQDERQLRWHARLWSRRDETSRDLNAVVLSDQQVHRIELAVNLHTKRATEIMLGIAWHA